MNWSSHKDINPFFQHRHETSLTNFFCICLLLTKTNRRLNEYIHTFMYICVYIYIRACIQLFVCYCREEIIWRCFFFSSFLSAPSLSLHSALLLLLLLQSKKRSSIEYTTKKKMQKKHFATNGSFSFFMRIHLGPVIRDVCVRVYICVWTSSCRVLPPSLSLSLSHSPSPSLFY